MDIQRVDMWLMSNRKYFPADKMVYLKEKLLSMDESKFSLAIDIQPKDPIVLFFVSFFVGTFGIDRFMLGDVAIGLLKLFTIGVFGIFTIVDWFMIMKLTREKNFQKIMSLL